MAQNLISFPLNRPPATTTTSTPPTVMPPPPSPRNQDEVDLLAGWTHSHGAQWVRENGNRVLFEARAMGDV